MEPSCSKSTSDPDEAATAFVGDSMLGDPQLALEALIDLVPENPKREWPSFGHPPLRFPAMETLC